MEHHILARFAQVVLVIFSSIVSPVFGCITIYLFLIGWFINEEENKKLHNYKIFRKLPGFVRGSFMPKKLFNFGMINIIMQIILQTVFIDIIWGIFSLTIYFLGLVFGIFSTK